MNEFIYLLIGLACFAVAVGLVWGCDKLMPVVVRPTGGLPEAGKLRPSGPAAGGNAAGMKSTTGGAL